MRRNFHGLKSAFSANWTERSISHIPNLRLQFVYTESCVAECYLGLGKRGRKVSEFELVGGLINRAIYGTKVFSDINR